MVGGRARIIRGARVGVCVSVFGFAPAPAAAVAVVAVVVIFGSIVDTANSWLDGVTLL